MADVEFTAGFQDLKTLQGILENNIPKAARDSAAAMETAFRKQEAAVNRLIKRNESLGQTALSVTKGNQSYYNSVLGITKAKTDLTAKTSLLVRGLEEEARASKEKSVATQRESKELEGLRQSYDPLYRASQLYAKQEAELQVLMNSGVGSTQRYQQALDQLNKEYQDFGNGVATATNRFASNAKGAQRGMNGLGMAMQQTGYQVGDFLVQVQGGTNPMVAFGQQATQLVGVLYLLPPALLNSTVGIRGLQISVTALIASLGIIIPLATAIGAAWMRTREDNDKASKGVKTLNDELKSLDSTLQDWVKSKKASEAGVTVEELLGISGIKAAENNLEKAKENLTKFTDATIFSTSASEAMNLTAEAMWKAFGLGSSTAEEYEAALKAVATAENRLYDLRVKQSGEQLENFSQASESLRAQLALEQTIAKFGADSAQAKAKELENEIAARNRAIDQQVRSKDITFEHGKFLKQLEEAVLRVADGNESAADSAARLTDNIKEAVAAMGALTSFGVSIEKAIDVTSAKITALKTGANATVAGQISGQRFDLEQKRTEALGAGADPLQVNAEYAINIAALEQYEKQLNQVSQLEESVREARRGGGGGGSKKDPSARSTEGISSFVQTLIGTQEGYEAQVAQAEAWKEDAFARMKDFNAAELEILGGHAEAKALIEEGYQKRVADIERAQQNARLSATSSFLGSMASVLQHGGEKANKVAQVLGAGQALINTFVAQSQVLADPTLGFYQKIAAYAAIGAAGFGLVASLKGAGGGGSTGGSASTPIATPTAQEQQGPQEVLLKGLKPGMRLSPEELQEVFDQIYDENDRRGTIFRVDLS